MIGRWTFRRFSLPILLLLIAGSTSIAQPQPGDEDYYNFDEIPVDEYTQLTYIGFGAGYLGMVGLLNYDELNGVANDFGFEGEPFSGPLLQSGGGGFVGGLLFPNVRLGVYTYAGSKSVTRTVSLPAGTYDRTLRYASNFIGGQLDYAIILGSGLTVFPGALIGRGEQEIELTQTRSGGDEFDAVFSQKDFDSLNVEGENQNRNARILNLGFHVQPSINIEYAVTQFFLIRLGAGYGLNLGSTWKGPAGQETRNVPEIKADGMNLQFGVFLGLFQK